VRGGESPDKSPEPRAVGSACEDEKKATLTVFSALQTLEPHLPCGTDPLLCRLDAGRRGRTIWRG
jgi:hypothetical protein